MNKAEPITMKTQFQMHIQNYSLKMPNNYKQLGTMISFHFWSRVRNWKRFIFEQFSTLYHNLNGSAKAQRSAVRGFTKVISLDLSSGFQFLVSFCILLVVISLGCHSLGLSCIHVNVFQNKVKFRILDWNVPERNFWIYLLFGDIK